MAVYEHSYRPYAGAITPRWSRFSILPRHVFGAIFQSKLFVAFFATCFVCPLVMAILIYLRHNLNALTILNINPAQLVAIDSYFFLQYCRIQQGFGFLLAVIVGPILISRDVANNALPLYLSRPFSRSEYVIGKASVLFVLLSAVTWAPGLLLFLLQASLQEHWLRHNYWIFGSMLVSNLIWMTVLTMLALAISAWVKWRMAASGCLFALFIFPPAVEVVIDQLFQTGWGCLVSISTLLKDMTYWFFDEADLPPYARGAAPPIAVEWAAILLLGAACLWILWLKIRAYEVSR